MRKAAQSECPSRVTVLAQNEFPEIVNNKKVSPVTVKGGFKREWLRKAIKRLNII